MVNVDSASISVNRIFVVIDLSLTWPFQEIVLMNCFNSYILYLIKTNMESKSYLTIIIIISSFLIPALYTNTGIMFSIFEKAVAQEGAITPEDSVNDTQIDTDAGTTRSSPDFSALNDTATALT
jgi:hypothetical protein